MRNVFLAAAAALALGILGSAETLSAEWVAVRHPEGLVHGFLVLKSVDGKTIADGDLIQTSRGNRVTSRLVFHFQDGSVQDETTVFTQNGRFHLVSDRLVQRGPSFPQPVDLSVDPKSGRVVVRYREKDGAEKTIDEKMELPEDLANGLPLTLVKNIPPGAASTTVPMIVASPKPRLVHLVITRAGEDRFSVGGAPRKATRFNVHVDIGGLTGVLARLVGKQPRDTSVWVLEGEAPGFVRSQGQFFQGGPDWRIELASPAWPRQP